MGTVSKVDKGKALLALGQLPAAATIPAGPQAISDVRAYSVPLSGTKNSYVVLQPRTQSGLAGYGECKELSRADLKATSEAVLGRSASAYEALRPLVPSNPQAALDLLNCPTPPRIHQPDDGFCELPKGPGLGVDVSEKELERNQIT
jgi:L-alanine-DL-glutamate epimerase-like enolase superfamily enzyme